MRAMIAAILLPFVLAACGSSSQDESQTTERPKAGEEDVEMSIQLASPAFADGEAIPGEYSCQGRDVSPPLAWTGVPEDAVSLALIADDPDAPGGTWVHWVIFNLPPDAASLPEGVAKEPALKNGARQGVNDFKRTGYGGPCPPLGKAHRYHFKLYALDAMIEPGEMPRKQEIEKAMEGHVLAWGQLMGTYKR